MAGLFGEEVPDIVLKSLFKKYDRNKDGLLTEKEIRVLLIEDLGMGERESDAFSMLMDVDGNNSVSFDEFKGWIRGNNRSGLIFEPTGKRYQLLLKSAEYFKEFDLNDNGALEGEEIMRLMDSVGVAREKTDAAVKAIDRDQNGKISFHEFLKWLRWIPMDEDGEKG